MFPNTQKGYRGGRLSPVACFLALNVFILLILFLLDRKTWKTAKRLRIYNGGIYSVSFNTVQRQTVYEIFLPQTLRIKLEILCLTNKHSCSSRIKHCVRQFLYTISKNVQPYFLEACFIFLF